MPPKRQDVELIIIENTQDTTIGTRITTEGFPASMLSVVIMLAVAFIIPDVVYIGMHIISAD